MKKVYNKPISSEIIFITKSLRGDVLTEIPITKADLLKDVSLDEIENAVQEKFNIDVSEGYSPPFEIRVVNGPRVQLYIDTTKYIPSSALPIDKLKSSKNLTGHQKKELKNINNISISDWDETIKKSYMQSGIGKNGFSIDCKNNTEYIIFIN